MKHYFSRAVFSTAAVLFLAIFNATFLFSQTPIRCYSTEYDSIRHANNPDLQSNEQFEAWIDKLINEREKMMETAMIINGVYQIPVVVHVIHNGEAVGTGTNLSVAAIQSQIDVLNEDFRKLFGTNGWNTHPDGADSEIEFCLARRRPDGTAFPAGEDGINRINRNTVGWTAPPYTTTYIDGTIKPYCTTTQFGGWDPGDYMNFWSCNISGGILGYAQFPTTVLGGMGCSGDPEFTDGVVMLYSSIGKSSVTGFTGPYSEGRTATHEIGHWLGLRHIWGDGGCGLDDFCADTPLSDAANFGCPTTNSCADPAPDPNDMVENYMDYTDDLCMNIFTEDQKMRMRIVLENSPIRFSLINSDACIPPAVSDASVINILNPSGDNCPGSIAPSVTLRNRGSSNLTSATIEYTIDNGTPTTFSWSGSIAPGAEGNVTLPVFSTTYGIHTIKAYSLLPNGVVDPDPTYDTTELLFAVSNGYQPDYLQDFEAGTFPPDVRWEVVNPNADCFEWIGSNAVSSTGAASNNVAMMTNFGNSTGQDEYLYTPIFILPCNASYAELTFDKAYRRRITGSTDRLRVEISEDCGATWNPTPLYDQQGTGLQSVTTTLNAYWIPSAAGDWDNVVLDLTSFVTTSSKNVQFRFRATNAGASGGNLYLDNVEFNAISPAEIQVTVSGADVLDEGYYNYGSQAVSSTTTAVFTITNTGTSNLILTPPVNLSGDPEFVINSGFGSTTIAPGGTTTFSIDFTPTGAGPYTANVSFGTNDCDEATYNFVISGSGNVTPPVANFTVDPTVICEGATVTYTDASTGASTWSWTFTGGTPASATGVGPHVVTYSGAGSYSATLDVTNAFGSDNLTQSNIITVLPGSGTATLPVAEGFVSATFPPVNWSINNGGNAITWVRSGTQGTAPTAGNSARIDNFNTNTTGNEDDLVMEPADFSGFSSAQLEFDVAYARYDATYFDQLDVLVSTDCGQTFNVVYSKAGSVLATDPDQTGGYTAPATWRTETIDLTPYIGNSKVEILFRNISGWGQFLYIDNINLTGVTATEIADFTVSPNPACIGETLTFTDASTGATVWSWDFGPGANPATATGAGPHTVTYSVAALVPVSLTINGGSDVSNQNITINPMDDASFAYASSSYCSSDANPVPTISGLTGGTFSSSPAGLTINSATGEIDLTTSVPNVYTITYTTSGSCPNSLDVSVTINSTPSAPVVTVTDNCGSSDLSATGSNLLWSTSETTATITVTSSGIYTVTQTVNGCTSAPGSGTASPITIPLAPVVTVTDNCGSSGLSATGSNLLWSTSETTPTITVASSGIYTVTQTLNGCTSAPGSGTANPIAIPSAPVVTVTDNCGNSDLSATGSNLLWSTSETTPTITVTSSGIYTVTQTVNGCTSAPGSGTANPIAIPSAPVVTVTDNCGNSDLSATGSNLLWSTSETTATITVTSSGIYTVTQTVNGCTSAPGSGTASPITIPSAPVITVTDNCGSSDLSATGSNLLWSTSETTPTITVTSSGIYTVTQTVNGCTSAPGSGTANPLSTPVISVGGSVDPSSCGNNDGEITINGSGTGNISWSGASSGFSNGIALPYTITGLTAGSYSVVFDNGCASSPLSASLTDPSAPPAPLVTVTDNCGNSDLSATGSNLLWSTGETTTSITVTSPGVYTVTQMVGGCTSSPGSGTANPIVIPSVPVVTVTDNCGNSDLSATGSNLLWSTSETTPTITVTSSGIYTVTQTVNGCTSTPGSGTANPIAIPSAPVVTVTDNCGSSDLSATGSNLLWSTSETTPTITVTSSGIYTVTQTVNGCTSAPGSGTANPIAIPSAPVVTVTDNCGSSDLSAAGSNLLWSTSETTPTITVTSSGIYTVTQTVNGCTSTPGSGTANPIAIPSAPVVTVTDNCGSSDLSATGSNLLWSTSETTPTITVTSSGIYTVTQTVNGCTSALGSGTANPFSIPAAPLINASGSLIFCEGESVDLSSSESSGNLWSTAETTQSITVNSTGVYFVTYTDVNGCSATSATVSVSVNPLPVVSLAAFQEVCLQDNAFSLSGGSPSGGTYSGTGVTGGIFDPAVAGSGAHVINYFYTDTNGCTNSAQEVQSVKDCAGLDELSGSLFIVYPNPTFSSVVIEGTEGIIEHIEVLDAAGRLVFETTVNDSVSYLDLSSMSPGVYQLLISNGEHISIERITKY